VSWAWQPLLPASQLQSGGAVALVVQDATLSIAADSPALTQHNVLAVADALLALLAESPTLTAHAGGVWTDNFNRGTGIGANWGNSVGGDLAIQGSTACTGSTGGTDNSMIWVADTPADAQYAQAICVISGGLPDYAGVLVRASATDWVILDAAENESAWKIEWYNGGAWTQLGATYSAAPANGDLGRLEAAGSDFEGFVNGTSRITASNGSAPATGSTGAYVFGNANGLDDFEGGDLAGAIQLVVQDSTLAIAADGPALTQHNVLVLADALLALAADGPALTQHNVLVVADALLALAAETPTLTAHDPAVQLVVQDALLSLGVDSPALTQHNALAVADALLALAVDGAVITQHNVIAVAEALLALAADNIVLELPDVLAVQDATVALVVDNIALVQHGVLVVQDALLALAAESSALTQHNVLMVADALLSFSVESPTLTAHGGFPGHPGSMLAEIVVLVEGHVTTEIIVSPSEAEVFLVDSIVAVLQPINEGTAEGSVELVGSVVAEIVGGQSG